MASKSRIHAARWAMAALLALISGTAAALEWYMPVGVTRLTQEVYTLHNYVMILVIVIFVGVFAAMFYSVFAHRKSKGHKAAQFHENTTVEVIWTVVPFIILIFVAWPATKSLVAMRDTSNPDITIKATGYQWKWGYDYIKGDGEGISFLSVLSTPRDQIEGKAEKGEHYLLEVDNPLVVPVGKKVRILTTAADVIHSWSVPAFGVKQDAIPGFIRDTWFRAEKPGTYRGQCAELCGKDHGFMPVVVQVLGQDEYAQWTAEQKKKAAAAADDPAKVWTMDDMKARGQKVYESNCVACHQASGKGAPPAFPPLDGSKIANGPTEAHIDIVLNGKANTAMAAFGKQLSDTEIAAAVTYTRNAWGNRTGTLVQPADVKARRK